MKIVMSSKISYKGKNSHIKKKFSFIELRDQVALCAGALNALGVEKGDRIIIYMPMIPETVIAMLACARIGAIHGVVFGGFASAELAVRIDDARPKAIISASCGIEVNKVIPYSPLLNDAIEFARHKPSNVIVVQRPELQSKLKKGRDLNWNDVFGSCDACGMCSSKIYGSAIYSLYIWHHRTSKGSSARQWWSCCCSELFNESCL